MTEKRQTNQYHRADGFDDAELQELCTSLYKRFTNVRRDHRFKRAHFHNLREADPKLPEPYTDAEPFQTDFPRRLHSKLLGRLLENKVRIIVESGREEATLQTAATNLATVLTQGLEFVQDRQNVNLQSHVATGLIAESAGWLHWTRADDIWPDLPEREFSDEPKDGFETYKASDDDHAKEAKRDKKPKYRESFDHWEDRVKRDQAVAGFPYYMEVVPGGSLSYAEDRSLENGYAAVMYSRVVGRLLYMDAVKRDREKIEISINESNPKVPFFGERVAPDAFLPSADDWGEQVVVHELWTRDECYEIVTDEGMYTQDMTDFQSFRQFTVVKSFKHKWGMPPFAPAPAADTASPDPVLRFECALEGVYRLKPSFDRYMTLMKVIAEMVALPIYVYQSTGDGRPKLDEKGHVQKLSRNHAFADMVPEGYRLEKVEFEVNPAFVQAVEFIRDEMVNAAPSVGDADVTGSTQPWAIRLQQAINNIEPALYVDHIANAFQVMMRSIAGDMSLKPEDGGLRAPVCVYKRLTDGKVDYSEVISVDPEDIKSLNIHCKIDATSQAERVTLMQIGREMMADPNIRMPLRTFLEEYMGDENPDETEMDWISRATFKDYLQPGLIRMGLASWAGSQVLMGPNGVNVGMGGDPMQPGQAAAAAGVLPPEMPGQGTLSVPGQLPVRGQQ